MPRNRGWNVTCHPHACHCNCSVFRTKQNDRTAIISRYTENQRTFCSAFRLIKYSRIFLVEPPQVVAVFSMFSFWFHFSFSKWLNIIGNHLHTSEQAKCDWTRSRSERRVSKCVLMCLPRPRRLQLAIINNSWGSSNVQPVHAQIN